MLNYLVRGRIDESDDFHSEGQLRRVAGAGGTAARGRFQLQVLHAEVRKVVLEIRQKSPQVMEVRGAAHVEQRGLVRELRQPPHFRRNFAAELRDVPSVAGAEFI